MPSQDRAVRYLNHNPEAVKWARERTGVTQAWLAEKAGISISLMSEIETGTRSATPVVLAKFADALNCPVAALERKRTEMTDGGQ